VLCPDGEALDQHVLAIEHVQAPDLLVLEAQPGDADAPAIRETNQTRAARRGPPCIFAV